MERYVEPGLAYCEERDLDVWGRLLLATRSWVALERGDWDRAAETVELVLMEDCTLSCLQARIVLGLLRARRGDPDPWTPLAEAREVAERTGQLWWTWQVAAAEAEALWLEGRPEAIADATADTFEWQCGSARRGPSPSSPGGAARAASRSRSRPTRAVPSSCSSAATGTAPSRHGGTPAAPTRRRSRWRSPVTRTRSGGARRAPRARSPARGGHRRAPPAGARRAWGAAWAAAGDEGESGEPHAAGARGARAGGPGSPERRDS